MSRTSSGTHDGHGIARLVTWATALATLALYVSTYVKSTRRLLLVGPGQLPLEEWIVLILPVAGAVLAIIWRRGGRAANWLRMYRRSVVAVFAIAALFSAFLLWERGRVVVGVLVILVLGAWLLRTVVERELQEMAERSRRQADTAPKPASGARIVLADDLRLPLVNESIWIAEYGSPVMVFPTIQGLVIRWRQERRYKQSGQLCAELPGVACRVDVKMEARRYGSGWEAGVHIYGTDKYAPLVGVGFMPQGYPAYPSAIPQEAREHGGLAIVTAGDPARPFPLQVLEKLPRTEGQHAHVRIELRGPDAKVWVDNAQVWGGCLAGAARELCLGVPRWPHSAPSGKGHRPDAAEYVFADIRVTTLPRVPPAGGEVTTGQASE